jgi:hypothetical protein
MSVTLAGTSHALGPGDKERGFREGANHHVGDEGFIEAYGRTPHDHVDAEPLRMHSHFTHVRRWLTDRKATKPELEEKRKEILGYFDEYIAKGTTPQNAHVPWRTPVFIDDHGTICAVGYLIEKTAGRPLAEKVAREHRYNVLEDIAAAMPEVRSWVEASGFTLEELASIQPGYTPVMTWDSGDLLDSPVDFQPIELATSDKSGTFRSVYPNGSRLAEGPFQDKKPAGTWRFFHPSGNLAAQGSFSAGARDGEWKFFYDAKDPVVKAKGSFQNGVLIEDWKHYDSAGKLVAIARPSSPETFKGAGYLLDVMPSAERVRHWVHTGKVAGTRHRLDYLADGTEQLYVHDTADIAYDAGGHKLSKVGDTWTSSDCHWNRVRRASARHGDVATLHGLTYEEKEVCDAATPLPEERAKHVSAMLAFLHEKTLGDVVAANMQAILVKPEVEVTAVPRVLVSLR